MAFYYYACEVPGLKPTACLSPADPAANWVRSWPRTGSLASPEGSVNEACLSPADPAAPLPKKTEEYEFKVFGDES